MNKPAFQILGLTGPTGAGKGAISAVLSDCGIPVLDTDVVSRIVYEPGQPCLSALTAEFGTEILLPDGNLDRAKLAALVFGEPDPEKKKEKLSSLNRIAHRYILAYSRDWLAAQKAAGYSAACIDAPQLFESGFDRECDYIIGVTAQKETRIARIMARDGITEEKTLARISAQHDDAFFARNCDVLLENNGSKESLTELVKDILRARGLLS